MSPMNSGYVKVVTIDFKTALQSRREIRTRTQYWVAKNKNRLLVYRAIRSVEFCCRNDLRVDLYLTLCRSCYNFVIVKTVCQNEETGCIERYSKLNKQKNRNLPIYYLKYSCQTIFVSLRRKLYTYHFSGRGIAPRWIKKSSVKKWNWKILCQCVSLVKFPLLGRND